MNRVGKLLSRLVAATTIVGAVAVILMVLHVAADVLLRTLFRAPIPATTSIVANYYMAVVSFLPVALAEKMDQHIAVDVVHNMLPEGLRKWMLQFVRLIVAIAAGGAAYGFYLDAARKFELNSYVLEMNVKVADWPGYFMLPIGFGLWSLINLYKIVADLGGYSELVTKDAGVDNER